MADTVRVQTTDFDVAAEYAALRGSAQTGAVAMFVGLVRDFGDVSQVGGLCLEHYPGMTEKVLWSLVGEARTRWPLAGVCIVHRVGELALTEQIVFVGVASGHREEAFAACEFLMDYLKTRAPFWKREIDRQGVSRWVGQKGTDVAREGRWQEPATSSRPAEPPPPGPGTPRA